MKRRGAISTLMGAFAALFSGGRLHAAENAENVQVWTTLDGREIRIVDLTDDHLRNIIFYMNKMYGYRYPSRILRGTPAEISGLYDAMRREAQRRNLSWI